MSAWTPGPWRYSPSQWEGEFTITGSDKHGTSVLPVLGRTHNWPRNAEANARLIASAPCLAEALENALAAGLPKDVAEAARAALRRAKGEA